VSGHAQAPAVLLLRNNPGTHRTGNFVVPIASMDILQKRKIFFPFRDPNPRILATILAILKFSCKEAKYMALFQYNVISDFGVMGQSCDSLSGHGGLTTPCRSSSSVKTVHVRGCRAAYCTEITSFIRGSCEELPVSPNCC